MKRPRLTRTFPHTLPHALILLLAGLAVLACGPSPAPQQEPPPDAATGEQAAEQNAPNLADWLDLPDDVEPIDFPATQLTMQTKSGPIELDIFIADTQTRRQRGLMYATGLPPASAMLFIFDQPTTHSSFWNNNVPIDLHVAFLDAEGRIMEFVTLKARSRETRRPTQPYTYALEMPAGRYAELGIEAGDQLIINLEAIGQE